MDKIILSQARPYTLKRNGQLLLCPFQARMLVPGDIQGTVAINKEPCCESCVMFEKKTHINEGENGHYVTLHCTGIPVQYEVVIEEKKATCETTKSGIITGNFT